MGYLRKVSCIGIIMFFISGCSKNIDLLIDFQSKSNDKKINSFVINENYEPQIDSFFYEMESTYSSSEIFNFEDSNVEIRSSFCDIEYEFFRVSPKIGSSLNQIKPSKYIVNIKGFSKENLLQMDKNQLLELLEKGECSWEANLLLYSLTEKDAIVLLWLTEEEWKIVKKEEDIRYWKQYISKSQKLSN